MTWSSILNIELTVAHMLLQDVVFGNSLLREWLTTCGSLRPIMHRKTMEPRRIVELTEPLNRRSAARKVNLWESARRAHFQHSR